MKFHSSYLTIRSKRPSLICFLICAFLLVLPSLLYAQDEGVIQNKVDCSIPKDVTVGQPGAEGASTTVKIGLYLIDIKEIQDPQQTFLIDAFLNFSWLDSRLSQKVLGRSLQGCKVQRNDIWFPSVFPVNVKSADIKIPKVSVDDEGHVRYQFRLWGEFSSDFDFTEFPFDQQILTLVFSAFGEDVGKVTFEVDEAHTGSRDKFSVEGWTVKLIQPEQRAEYHAPQGRYISEFHFRLLAKRFRGYYLWKVLLPLFFIVLMAWGVFWVDLTQIPPRIGLATATVFTLIAYRFSLGLTLPKISYFTRMDQFILLSTILVFFALGTAISSSRLASQGKHALAEKIENWAKRLYLVLLAIILVIIFLI